MLFNLEKNISLLLFSFLFFGCYERQKEGDDIECYYIESIPSFFELKHGDWLQVEWIRKPENLKMIHETFKSFEYEKLLSKDLLESTPFFINSLYINREGCHLLDSLIISYKTDVENEYYTQFWQRRENEKNDSMVYAILTDIQSLLIQEPVNSNSLLVDSTLTNDTLFHLLTMEFRQKPITEEQAYHDIKGLIELGFHESAYNLLYKRSEYDDINFNRDTLGKQLIQSPEYSRAWFDYNTK